MFDHVAIRACDRAASEAFYTTVLRALAIEASHHGGAFIEFDDFSIAAAADAAAATRHLHIAFVAPSRAAVDAFWEAGTAAGYRDDGAPGVRAHYRPDYYGAFLLDPDGNSAEAVHHANVRRGGHIDHLWIGVRELRATAAFYATIARHTGLRDGAGWDRGQQFCGAWASLAVVEDRRAATENLHIAFPAPDRETVRDFHAAAIEAGYRDNGAPGERSTDRAGCYAACVLDPDGTNVESVCRERD